MMKAVTRIGIVVSMIFALGQVVVARPLMERLNRGLVAVRSAESEVFLSWRLLGTELPDTGFNVYRTPEGGSAERLNSEVLTAGTYFIDTTADTTVANAYYVRPVVAGFEEDVSETFTLAANTSVGQYLSVPIEAPPTPACPDGSTYTYSANDASVADLDGDGELEIILKWDPSNTKRPAETGYTGDHIFDAYKLDGTRLWRIDMGPNIKAGAAVTQLMVYDLDGDGRAEVAMRTCDAAIDGLGNMIGDDIDWRVTDSESDFYGKVIEGPEYLTVFDGQTGGVLAITDYVPDRYPIDGWGGVGGNAGNDTNANRVDHFSAGIAYLDGERPSLVCVRGWYGRSVLAAWDWRDGTLTSRWVFDSEEEPWVTHEITYSYPEVTDEDTRTLLSTFSGQGNHSLTVGDFDNDGYDEVCIGAMTVDHDGQGLYSTGLRHGDALHASDLVPSRPGQEVFGVHENESTSSAFMTPGAALFDAATGEVLWGYSFGIDVGRGMAADIDPNYPGAEIWGGTDGTVRSDTGEVIYTETPSSTNFGIWWDGDLLRELADGTTISKWDAATLTTNTLLATSGTASNNSSKSNQCLVGDILGDWREEMVLRDTDSTELRIYTTTIETDYRFYTLLHDRQYRLAIAWQNVAYNQPPHPSFFLGVGMDAQPRPEIVTSMSEYLAPEVPTIDAISPDTGSSSTDLVTQGTQLTLSGTAEADATVQITLLGTGTLGTAVADSDGAWSFDYSGVTLADGSYYFRATASDADGNTSPMCDPVEVVVDTTSPAAPTLDMIMDDEGFVFMGTAEAGSTATVLLGEDVAGTGLADADGVWEAECTLSLPVGTLSFTARAQDLAGNDSALSAALTISTALSAPQITGIDVDSGLSTSDGVTSDSTPTISGTADASTQVVVAFLGGEVIGTTTSDASGVWSLAWPGDALTDGTYSIVAEATDGSVDSATSAVFAIAVDTAVPQVVSVTRSESANENTVADTVVFEVCFSEAIDGVDADWFSLVLGDGLTGGTISSVTTEDGVVYTVTISGLVGYGTVRLDVVAGNADVAGNALADTYSDGESYAKVDGLHGSGVWVNADGGDWSTYANWDGYVRPDVAGDTVDFASLDLTTDITVSVDTSYTVGDMTFGDLDTTTAGNWVVTPAADSVLTLQSASGTPTITVDALGTDAVARIDAPIAGTYGLIKAGAGTLELGAANTYSGSTEIARGTLRVVEGGVINTNGGLTLDQTAAVLHVDGGSFTATGNASIAAGNGSQIVIDDGTASFGMVTSDNVSGALFQVNGGDVTVNSFSFPRTTEAETNFVTGVITTGGSLQVTGSIALGTRNSCGEMSVEGGTVTVAGMITIANQKTAGRGGAMRVTGGTFTSNHTGDGAAGIVLIKNNGGKSQIAKALFLGGVSTVEKFTLGYDSSAVGTATLQLDEGTLYLGSGGIVTYGGSSFTAEIDLVQGVLGAKADWASSLPMTLSGDDGLEIKAADEAGDSFDITLSGELSGTGGFTKTGAGTLTLSAANTYTGATNVSAGTLALTGSVAGNVAVASGATLSGAGSIAGDLDLASGGTLAVTLGDSPLAVTGSLTKSGDDTIAVAISGTTEKGTTYTLVLFDSTTLEASDFEVSGGASDGGWFVVESDRLEYFVPPDPPVIEGDVTVTGTYGASFSYTIVASNSPTAYTAEGLPSGLTLDEATGVISGTPTVPGDYTVTLSAANAGGTGTGSILIQIGKASQTVTVTPIDSVTVGSTTSFGITASSGLAVTLEVLHGPAVIVDGVLTLTGAPGIVQVRASQSGDDNYTAAESVVFSFTVVTPLPPTYFGSVLDSNGQTAGTFGIWLASDGSAGTMLVQISATGACYIVGFVPDEDGVFSSQATSARYLPAGLSLPMADDGIAFEGALSGTVISGTIGEAGLTFTAEYDAFEGATADLVGYFESAALGTSDGGVYAIVGAEGDVFVLAVLADGTLSASGTIDDSGFVATCDDGTIISGTIDTSTGAIEGEVLFTDEETIEFAGLLDGVDRTDRIVNLSARGYVSTGESILIAGFVVNGSESKPVLVRAVGPGLAWFDVENYAQDPTLRLYRDGVVVAENDNWSSASNVRDLQRVIYETGAFSLASQSKDAALYTTLEPGTYTVHVEDANGGGIAIAEIYDASETPGEDLQRLVNISSRAWVGSGDNVLVGGFVVSGNAPKRVLIRGIGPKLADYGIEQPLSDPRVEVHSQTATLCSNDDWGTGSNSVADLEAAAELVSAFALTEGSKDAALLVTLAPGAYTAIVTGQDGAEGIALVEVYELPED